VVVYFLWALELSGLLLPLWPIYFFKHLVRLRAYVVWLDVSAVLPLLEVCVVVLIFVKFDEPLISVASCTLSACRPIFKIASSIVRLLLAVAPSAYMGSACTTTFLVLTNWLRKPLADALSRVSSLALAASCSAASIALDGVFFCVVVVG
jgi:hypothetical protein